MALTQRQKTVQCFLLSLSRIYKYAGVKFFCRSACGGGGRCPNVTESAYAWASGTSMVLSSNDCSSKNSAVELAHLLMQLSTTTLSSTLAKQMHDLQCFCHKCRQRSYRSCFYRWFFDCRQFPMLQHWQPSISAV